MGWDGRDPHTQPERLGVEIMCRDVNGPGRGSAHCLSDWITQVGFLGSLQSVSELHASGFGFGGVGGTTPVQLRLHAFSAGSCSAGVQYLHERWNVVGSQSTHWLQVPVLCSTHVGLIRCLSAQSADVLQGGSARLLDMPRVQTISERRSGSAASLSGVQMTSSTDSFPQPGMAAWWQPI